MKFIALIFLILFSSSTWSPDASLFSGDMEKIKKSIFTSSYHVIENNENEFIIVKGNVIYEAHKEGLNKSSLKVYQLTGVERPLEANLDWWKLLKTRGLSLNFAHGPVDFLSSRKYQQEDKVRKNSLFFFIDKAKAEKMEADLLAKQDS
ncbi:MAG: hypothetical protein H7336_14630 [Bacteriovorax sp.]|nr:hypothetical protein [Bacteriovorax sp.]